MKIPKNEIGMTTYIFNGVESYKITRNSVGKYVLYKIINQNNCEKMKYAESPIDLEAIINKDRGEQNAN